MGTPGSVVEEELSSDSSDEVHRNGLGQVHENDQGQPGGGVEEERETLAIHVKLADPAKGLVLHDAAAA